MHLLKLIFILIFFTTPATVWAENISILSKADKILLVKLGGFNTPSGKLFCAENEMNLSFGNGFDPQISSENINNLLEQTNSADVINCSGEFKVFDLNDSSNTQKSISLSFNIKHSSVINTEETIQGVLIEVNK